MRSSHSARQPSPTTAGSGGRALSGKNPAWPARGLLRQSCRSPPAAQREMWIYNGTITALAYVNNTDGNLGDLSATQSASRMQIDITVPSGNLRTSAISR